MRSRKALGQIEFPSMTHDDLIQVKEEEIDKEKEKPDDLVKTEAWNRWVNIFGATGELKSIIISFLIIFEQ